MGYNLKSTSILALTITIIVLVGAGYLGHFSVITLASAVSVEGGHTEGWMRVVSGGFNDSNNNGINNYVIFKGYLYGSVVNDKTGVEIWRTQDGTRWEKVGADGLGNPNNHSATLFVFRDKLYAGTSNDVDGSEIWVSSDGVKFTQLVSGGLGDRDNSNIGIPVAFIDKLLVPVQNGAIGSIKDGAEIWISEDGENFRRTVKGGLGDRSNIQIHFLVHPFKDYEHVGIEAIPFKDRLYLGTRNPASGGEVWRSIDGVEWEKTVDDGFGEAVNEASYPQLVFRDQLYVVTFNLNGLNVFRSSDGEVWEKVVENGFGYGKYRNIYGVLREIGGTLYLSTFSTPKIGAFQIWKSNDGKDWTQVGQTGFGNENNHGAGISICSDGLMYVSTLNFLDGLEVWRSKDCLKWEMIFKEEHGSETHVGGGLIEFNNYLYMHIYDRDGLQIWKYMTQLRTVTSARTLTTSAYSTLTQTSTATKLFWGIKEYAIIIVAAAVGALALLLVSKSAIFAKSKKRAAYCIHCGALIDESDEFCRKCGKQQQ